MARTGLWFQFARGRALVRTREMKKARAAKAALARNTVHTGYMASPLTETERMRLKTTIRWAVRRARDAHREWRKYRKLWDQEQADNRELEARFPTRRKNV